MDWVHALLYSYGPLTILDSRQVQTLESRTLMVLQTVQPHRQPLPAEAIKTAVNSTLLKVTKPPGGLRQVFSINCQQVHGA